MPAAAAAVRGGLSARRDAAASTLAFEFAARLQAEIEALDWVTAEQKVTRPATARAHLRETPAEWTVFAQRNARLAG